jgi:hypothetical protein
VVGQHLMANALIRTDIMKSHSGLQCKISASQYAFGRRQILWGRDVIVNNDHFVGVMQLLRQFQFVAVVRDKSHIRQNGCLNLYDN